MKLLIKYSILLFISLNLVTAFAQSSVTTSEADKLDTRNQELVGVEKQLRDLRTKSYKPENKCYSEANKDRPVCKEIKEQREALEADLNKLYARETGHEQDSCKEAYDAFTVARQAAADECKKAGLLNFTVCIEEKNKCKPGASPTTSRPSGRARRGSTSSDRVCQTKVLEELSRLNPRYKDMEKDDKDSKSDVERAEEDLRRLNLELIGKQSEEVTARQAAEKVVRDATAANNASGQAAVQRAFEMQAELDRVKFEIEDLETLKSNEYLKAKNAIEDAKLACYEIAVQQYSEQHNQCLTRKRRRISEGKYSSRNLKTFFSSNRKGSCKQTNRQQWYNKYQDDCTSNKTHKENVRRIGQQYIDTAKNINTTIKRRTEAQVIAQQQLDTFQENRSQSEQAVIEEQRAQLQSATARVGQIGAEIAVLRDEITKLQGKLRQLQTDQADITRNKAQVKKDIAENEELIGSYDKEDVDVFKNHRGAFLEIDELLLPIQEAKDACCKQESTKRTNRCTGPKGVEGSIEGTSPRSTSEPEESSTSSGSSGEAAGN